MNPQWRRIWENLKEACWHMRLPTTHPYCLTLAPDLTPIPLNLPALPPPPVLLPPICPLRPIFPTLSLSITLNLWPFSCSPIWTLLLKTTTGQTTLQYNKVVDGLAVDELPMWLLEELLSLVD